ncbi:MAG: hypothetical protein DRP45_04575 [Candidatus Zixiibacteriota bacterium]|nr:MAG: hypothetical protein DRP45_04575 [candidate division Zixibacteria bacterium]
MATKKTTTKKKTEEVSKTIIWPFGPKNYILFGIALAVIAIGYVFLGYGDDPDNAISKTLAPIVLVIGYAVVPFAIMAKGKPDDTESDSGPAES